MMSLEAVQKEQAQQLAFEKRVRREERLQFIDQVTAAQFLWLRGVFVGKKSGELLMAIRDELK